MAGKSDIGKVLNFGWPGEVFGNTECVGVKIKGALQSLKRPLAGIHFSMRRCSSLCFLLSFVAVVPSLYSFREQEIHLIHYESLLSNWYKKTS